MFPARKDTLIGRRDRAILQAFAKIKHWMRAAQKRTTEDAWRHPRQPPRSIQHHECSNYCANAGYASIKR